MTSPVSHYTYGQLRDLWVQAGGRPDQAPLAAAVAMAESGGRNVRSQPNSNGSYDVGPWQINSSHGSQLASLDPLANARAAVQMSGNGTNWRPWCTAWTNGCSGTYDPMSTSTPVGKAFRSLFASTNSPPPVGPTQPGAVPAGQSAQGVPVGAAPPAESGGLLGDLFHGLIPDALTGAFWAHTLDVICNWLAYLAMTLIGLAALGAGVIMAFKGTDVANVAGKIRKMVPV